MSIATSARSRRAHLGTFALAVAMLAGGTSQASAQWGHRVQIGGNQNPGTTTVSPRSAAKGAPVNVAIRDLPPGTPVQIMIGALQDGFEVVSTFVTDDNGRMNGRDTVAVTVPDWVKTDRSYLVMLTDTSYRPLAAADVFHPTDPTGGLSRRGTVKWEDPRCPTLTGPSGEMYFLVGETKGLPAGEDVVLKGKVTEVTPCGPTTTIRVESFHPFGT